jgi:lactate dehydrogenase-like 2-hydroxyacid dehydrogenase
VIGPGQIGQAVLKRGVGFSMKLLYSGPHEKPELTRIGAEERTN